MRIAATAACLLVALASCSTSAPKTTVAFQQPNELMRGEIDTRIEQIPFQHREELVQNLLWLAQTGEQTIPSLLDGLRHENPKVRSSCCWVLGRLRDRRTVDNLQPLVRDAEASVRMEAARSLVLMGDLNQSPTLIEGLDSERKEVRFMCHEALKSATGHDFGYDHLTRNHRDLQVAVLRWREWWGEYSGDRYFAASYEKAHDLNNVAAPSGETQRNGEKQNPSGANDSPSNQNSTEATPNVTTPSNTTPSGTGSGTTGSNTGSDTTTNGGAPSNGAPATGNQPVQVTPVEVTPVEVTPAQPGTEQPMKGTPTPSKVVELPAVEVPQGNGGNRR